MDKFKFRFLVALLTFGIGFLVASVWLVKFKASKTSLTETEQSSLNLQKEEQTYSTVTIDRFFLTLTNRDSKCVLAIKSRGKSDPQVEKNVTLKMNAPCEFVRMPTTLEPLSYSYGKKSKKQIFIVVGGKPDLILKDQFLPEGCGTEIQKVIVFEDEIRLGEKSDQIPVCPSSGLDEVFFGA